MSSNLAIAMHVAKKELRVQIGYRNKFIADVLSHVIGIVPILLITLALSGSSLNDIDGITRANALFVFLGYAAFMAFGFGTPIMIYTGMAWGISEELQTGTIERNFLAPVSRHTIVAGIGIYYACLYAFHVTTLMILAFFLFPSTAEIPVGNLAVAGTAALGLIALSAGLGLSSAAMFLMIRDGSLFLLFVHRPFMILSGAIFLIELLPGPLKLIALVNPVAYGVDAFRWAFSGHGTLEDPWLEVGIVWAGALVAAIVGVIVLGRVIRRQSRTGELSRI
ncbi:MAG: ABC transporter permease [Chloroflexi bacterium]|nr:ABC transporter permease [Chloroflexota bacterium]